MGFHSNYWSEESDMEMFIFSIIAIIIFVVVYRTLKLIKCLIKRHYYKQFKAEQRRVEQYKRIKAQKERAYQNTINNFFYNRIEEDIEDMLDISSNKLIDLYKN